MGTKTASRTDSALLLKFAETNAQSALRELQRRHSAKLAIVLRDELIIKTEDAKVAIHEAWKDLASDGNRSILPSIKELRGWILEAGRRRARRFFAVGTAAWRRDQFLSKQKTKKGLVTKWHATSDGPKANGAS